MNDNPENPILCKLTFEVETFVTSLDELYGHYIDSTVGFMAKVKMLTEAQTQMRPQMPGVDLDSIEFFYGHGNPTDPSHHLQHKTTQGRYKNRNITGGRNHVLAAQLLIVLIFAYWEHEYRPKFATALNLPSSNDLKVPVFGDLKLLRNDIVHHKGIVTKETSKKLSTISGLHEGAVITLTRSDIETLIHGIKAAMDSLVVKSGGTDPKHRTVWRFE